MIPLIYVAGRYRGPTRAVIAQNIDAARQVGVAAALLGWYPVIPHANTAHMELNTPHGDDFWLDGTLELMTRCDAVVLVPGWESSEGTKGEIAKARELRLPVYETLDWLPPATDFEPVVSSNSPKYKAELYDEVWQTATGMGYTNVTMALAELATMKAQKPVHWRAVLSPEEVPRQLNHHMHVVGFTDKSKAEDWVAAHRDIHGWTYALEELYAGPVNALPDGVGVPTYGSYTTAPGESVAGIALRQLKDESRWVEIRDLNAHHFPAILAHEYYPVRTVLRMPAKAGE